MSKALFSKIFYPIVLSELASCTSLSLGRLISPQDASKASFAGPADIRSLIEGKWTVVGDISGAMFKSLKMASFSDIGADLLMFSSSRGVCYAVFVHQVGNHQNRVILPLYDPLVRKLFMGMTSGQLLTICLADSDGSDVLSFSCDLMHIQVKPVLDAAPRVNEEQQIDAALELPGLLSEFESIDLIPSGSLGTQVEQVSVVVILPRIFTCAARYKDAATCSV